MPTRTGRFVREFLCALLGLVSSAGALEPGQVALIVNKNVPESTALAAYYAKVRGIPDGRIITLSIPVSEEMPFDVYERVVVPQIRDYLRDNKLEATVTCLVTFYGVPFRIGPHNLSARETAELADARDELASVMKRLTPELAGLEQFAAEVNPAFKPAGNSENLVQLAMRADAAFAAIQQSADQLNGEEEARIAARLLEIMQQLAGPIAVADRLNPQGNTGGTDEQQAARNAIIQRIEDAKNLAGELYDRRYDAAARADLRELTRKSFGLFGYARLLESQIHYFDSEFTVAATDSELSLLWWNYYPRKQWIPNQLLHDDAPPGTPRSLMVSRIDAPQAGTARDLIAASLKAEREGLKGRIVLDSRGLPANDAYGQYDQTIRALGELLRTRTQLTITVDDSPSVLPARSVKDVALYCGWYSLRNYVPAASFNPGAVGYHIASLEMVSLRDPKERGWVRGLLDDGIAGTMGAVAEPYLHSFPRADEFFPLLLTGKLTLAETYWKTQATASWMVCLIGDPLYTPYKQNPVLAVEDLPETLRNRVNLPASYPASPPIQAPSPNGR
jgi:uncharacterized protein (TIGR03790 family)